MSFRQGGGSPYFWVLAVTASVVLASALVLGRMEYAYLGLTGWLAAAAAAAVGALCLYLFAESYRALASARRGGEAGSLHAVAAAGALLALSAALVLYLRPR